MTKADSAAQPPPGEPWGSRLWLAVAVVVVAAVCLQSYGIRTWPMADDEVPSLVEMGLMHLDPQAFPVPANQLGKLPKIVPVWYKTQRFVIDRLPKSEVSYRVSSVVFGVLTSALVFVAAARWRGLLFAAALAILMNGSQPFVYLSQLDRFYAMPLLLTTATFVLMWAPYRDIWVVPAIAILSVLAVLSHNVTVAAFGLAFGASCAVWLLERARTPLVARSAVAACVGGLIYVFYLVPIVRGWASTGNPTPVLISFAAHLGTPTLAFALLGLALCVLRRETQAPTLWCALIFTGSLCLLEFTSMTWNPRYFVFFMPAAWVLGAHAVEMLARPLEQPLTVAAWYGGVGLLLMPNLMSHYADGSRHDYRAAARVVMQASQGNDAIILSDDAETISYYLPEEMRRRLFVRTKVTQYPPSQCVLVTRSNAWTALPKIPQRQVELLAEISHRRFDEFSHILRVFRIAPGPTVDARY